MMLVVLPRIGQQVTEMYEIIRGAGQWSRRRAGCAAIAAMLLA